MTGRLMAPVLVCLTALALGGCHGEGGNTGGTGGTDSSSRTSFTPWPEDVAPIDQTGLVRATGSTVRLADGSTIEVGAAIDTFVLAADGVFFTSTDDDAGPGYGLFSGARPLYHAGADGAADEVATSAVGLRSSPDGRYLAFLDLESGTTDDFGTPQAEAVVVDLRTGDEIVRSSTGMGDPGSDDLAHDYPESTIGILGFADDTVYVQAVDDVYAYDLATGRGTVSDLTGDDFTLPPFDDRLSADGRWRIVDDPAFHDRVAPAAGAPVAPAVATPLLNLLWWVDDRTAAGIAIDGQLLDSQLQDGALGTLVTCTVPEGTCTPVDGTEGQVVHLPEGTLDDSTLSLPDGS